MSRMASGCSVGPLGSVIVPWNAIRPKQLSISDGMRPLMSTNVRSLIARLNDATRSALAAAAGLCLSRTHYDIESEHLLVKLLDAPGTDVPIILKQFGLDKARVNADLTRSLDRLKSGNARTPSISPTLLTALKEAWNIGSLNYAAGQVRSGFVLLAALNVDELHRLLLDTSHEFEKI